MPYPLSSGHLSRWIAAQGLRGQVTARGGLTALALALEAKTKENLSTHGAHTRGTPTPATPGSGPSVITGDLRRAVTHEPIAEVGGVLQTRVGPASTPHSTGSGGQWVSASLKHKVTQRGQHTRGRSGGTTSGRIGLYLETGLRNGTTYPFLGPAFDEVIVGKVAPVVKTEWDSHGVTP
jgi:hypothetical protein